MNLLTFTEKKELPTLSYAKSYHSFAQSIYFFSTSFCKTPKISYNGELGKSTGAQHAECSTKQKHAIQ